MTAQLHKIEASPDLADQVYRALLDAISDGTLAPGQRITQDELAERFAVSRQPVMQALRLLKKDGFVQDAPIAHGPAGRCRGLQVTPIDAAWIAIQLMIGVATAGGLGDLGQIAIAAHIGGFLAGLALTRPLLRWRFRKRPQAIN